MSRVSDHWNASLYDKQHAYVHEFGSALVDRLAAAPHERVLDLGCGSGHLTAVIAETATVVGVDKSPSMLASARKAYPGIQFEEADAISLGFEDEFHAVFSNAALHWVKDLEAMAGSVYQALRRRGRFVAEMGARGNIEALVSALYLGFEANGISDAPSRNPWRFPSLGEMASLLEAAGFDVMEAVVFDRPTALDGAKAGLRNWYEAFAGPFFLGMTPRQKASVLDYAEFVLQESLFIRETWYADYRRLRFVAYKG